MIVAYACIRTSIMYKCSKFMFCARNARNVKSQQFCNESSTSLPPILWLLFGLSEGKINQQKVHREVRNAGSTRTLLGITKSSAWLRTIVTAWHHRFNGYCTSHNMGIFKKLSNNNNILKVICPLYRQLHNDKVRASSSITASACQPVQPLIYSHTTWKYHGFSAK